MTTKTDLALARNFVTLCEASAAEAKAKRQETYDAWQEAMGVSNRALDRAFDELASAKRRVRELEAQDEAERAEAVAELARKFADGLLTAGEFLAGTAAASAV